MRWAEIFPLLLQTLRYRYLSQYDAMLSFSLSSYGTESNYMGSKMNADKMKTSFDNAGFVISSKIGNATALRYVNFGF